MALRWTTALSIGVAELDAQHEELFQRVDRLLDAMLVHDRSEAVLLLAFLERYAAEHLESEERLMREAAYPDAALHVAEHRAFRAELAELVRCLDVEGPTARLVLRVERHATSWLRDHVYSSDHALGRWLVARRSAVACEPATEPAPHAFARRVSAGGA